MFTKINSYVLKELSNLLNKTILICISVILLSSCANTNNGLTTPKFDQTTKSINQPFKTLALTAVTFSEQVSAGKFQTECSMLQTLTDSILNASNSASIIIMKRQHPDESEYQLSVNYIDVMPHRWGFLAVRPSSNATLKITVLKKGVPIHRTTKLIGSAASLGACDRLNKIAIAGGRYITKWLHSL